MTLWVFGDSFAHHYPSLTEQWMNIVADHLKTDLKCFGLVASSAEFTYNNFKNNRQNIKPNDIVIVAQTTTYRRWFFRNFPDTTTVPNSENLGYTMSHVSPTGNKDESEALALYDKHLANEEVELQHLYNFLYNLDYLTQKLNTHTIVLINFYDTEKYIADKLDLWPNIQFAKDKTLVPSMDEFALDFFEKIDYKKGIKDVRVNHLVRDNHLILADKIIRNIKYKEPINLAKGFHKNIITVDRLNDKEWMDYQTFNFVLT